MSDRAMEIAAQLWCLPQHAHKEMDVEFAESIAAALRDFAEEAAARWKREADMGAMMLAALRALVEAAEHALRDTASAPDNRWARNANITLGAALPAAREALERMAEKSATRLNSEPGGP